MLKHYEFADETIKATGVGNSDDEQKKVTEKFLTIEEVCAAVNFSESSVYRLVERKKFPKKTKVELRRSFWLESEVVAWMKKCGAEK